MLRTKRASTVLLAMTLVATMAACRRGGGGKVGDLKDETMPRMVTLHIAGAHTLNLSEVKPLRILVRPATGDKKAASVTSISTVEFYPVGDGWMAQPEVAIVGVFEGDGDYTLPAGRGTRPTTGPTLPDPGADPAKLSVIQTTFDRFDKPGSAQRFDYALEPCVVHLADDSKSGSAKCPALAAYDGSKISMEITWGAP